MKRTAMACLGGSLALASASGVIAKSAASNGASLGQAAGERSTQQALPQSRAPLWAVLRHTKVGEDAKRGVFTAAFSPAVKALNGQAVTLSGFMLPLDTDPKSRHFLLSRYTPVCFFCPPGQPNEVVEVTAGKGVAVTDRMLTVTGRLALINNAEKGLFLRVDQAAVR